MENISAIIELGTKGIRLLVAHIYDGQIHQILKSTGDLSNLGKEADSQGNLSASSIRRVTQIATEYRDMANELEAESLHIIATEVVRKAPNRDLLQEAFADIAPIHILTNTEEAMCIFIASTASFKSALKNDQSILVIDQGGGSTELVTGKYVDGVNVIEGIAHAPLGTSSLTQLFLSETYLSEGFDKVRKHALHSVAKLPDFSRFYENNSPDICIAHGSAIMVYARGILKESKLRNLHGKSVDSQNMANQIGDTFKALHGKKASDKSLNLSADSELATLLSGIITYYIISRKYNISNYFLSREGLRFGALLWKNGVVCKFIGKEKS